MLSLLFLLVSQEPSPAKQEDVVIEGKKDPSSTTPSLPEAQRRIERTPGGVNVVDAEAYRTARAASLDDLFDYTPGVFAATRFGYEEARISIRGSGLQRTFHGRGLRVLQDGIPINLADGSFDMQQIEPLAARYVEVYRGANALRYGASTLGGAVNFVSPSGYDSARLVTRAEAGSFGYARGQIASGFAMDQADYYLSITNLEADGFREHADQATGRFFGNLGFKLSPSAENRVYLTYVQTDSELPGGVTRSRMRQDPEAANPANVAGDQKRDFDFVRFADKITWTSGDARLDASLGFTHKSLDHPIFQVIEQDSDDLVLYTAYTDESRWAGRRNTLTFGFLTTYGQTDEHRFTNLGGHTGAETADQDLSVANLELFVQNQHYVSSNLAFVAGLQAVVARMELDDHFGVDNSDDDVFRGVNPKIGLLMDVDQDIQVFFNVSRAMENPSFSEIANNAAGGLNFPEEQTSWTVELGTRGRSGIFAWDVAVYHAWVKDELLALVDPVTSAPLGTVNADDTIHRGVELGLSVVLLGSDVKPGAAADKLTLRQTYTLNDFRFHDDAAFDNNRAAGIPVHVYHAELRYETFFGVYVAPNVEILPKDMFIDHANTFEAHGYASYGIQLGYRAGNLLLFVDGRNLSDRIYAPTTGVIADAGGVDQAQFNAADERSFYAGAEVRW
ncbi:MAG TPA: TonB-dependent receptor [Planctomycetota bacterium]